MPAPNDVTRLRAFTRRVSQAPLLLLYRLTSILLATWGAATLIGLITLPLVPLVAQALIAIERRRGALIGRPITGSAGPPPPAGPVGWVRRAYRPDRAGRVAALYVITVVFGLVQLAVLAYCAVVLLLVIVLPAAVFRYHDDVKAAGSGVQPPEPLPFPGGPFTRVGDSGSLTFWMITGVLVVLVGWYLTGVLARVQARVVQLLLSTREADLETAVIELRGSRSVLITAFESDRERIERDLHDGAQQHLVMTTLRVGTALSQARAHEGEEKMPEVVNQLVKAQESAELALATLRRTVLGLHSDVLVDHGLTAAVEELAQRSVLPLTVHSALDRRFRADVERCAYFTVSEAVTNTLKHADASAIRVTLTTEGDSLVVRVMDDGAGGAAVDGGRGIRGLRERARNLGGTLAVSSPVGGPTTLTLEVPAIPEE
ncbi:sensor domain-containing protein [Microbacterium sp. HMH0099]|uniref:sensor histidine kinase n=1 Tax=Microbacterium sp. HMH0099 TaxID=3414026 RepID=UPI003BF693F3